MDPGSRWLPYIDEARLGEFLQNVIVPEAQQGVMGAEDGDEGRLKIVPQFFVIYMKPCPVERRSLARLANRTGANSSAVWKEGSPKRRVIALKSS
jgi:hypothetical protein